MIESEIVFQELQTNCVGGVKVPHLMSLPVISRLNGENELAVFVSFFTAEDVRLQRVVTPSKFVFADLDTGKITRARNLKRKRISNDLPSTDVELGTQSNMNKSYLRELFFVLDDTRKCLLDAGKLDIDRYCHYLSGIYSTVPLPYRQFYSDLSI